MNVVKVVKCGENETKRAEKGRKMRNQMKIRESEENWTSAKSMERHEVTHI